MKTKNFSSVVKADEAGSFKAIFSTFNVKDKDGDVTLPDAFERGRKVLISHYGHRWADLPVGKGSIDFDGEKAWVDGQFFLDTAGGKDTYQTVKNLEELQEWSYGFKVLESEDGTKDGEKVNILKKLEVFEVSPVLVGAGVGTVTESIKGEKEPVVCAIEHCKHNAKLLIAVCDGHGATDVVSFAKVLKQALAECDEEAMKALIVELTPQEPKAKGPRVFDMIAELSLARANSHSMGGQRS